MTSPSAPLIQVALPLPVPDPFTYRSAGETAPPVGSRVLVPFRREQRVGWVTGPHEGPEPSGVRAVLDVLDEAPSVSAELLELCRWISRYYVAPLGVAIRAALPAVLSDRSRDLIALVGDPASVDRSRERRLVRALLEAGGPRSVRTLTRKLRMGSLWPEIRALHSRGVLAHTSVAPSEPTVRLRNVVRIERWIESLEEREELRARAPAQADVYIRLEEAGGAAEQAILVRRGVSPSAIRGLQRKGVVSVSKEETSRDPFATMEVEPDVRPPLTPAQSSALDTIAGATAGPRPPVLLHGVTGSGKTLVYVEALERALSEGRGGIVLVPEISLTPQTVARFRARFGDQVAVLHSGLSQGERFDAWRSLREGHKRIAVGARSAVFAPVVDLGVIVVDEEHDGSYKQSDAPRYHARDVAVMRARLEGARCILGSATPSLETWVNAERGKYVKATLPERVAGGALPPVRLLDLREHVRRDRRRSGAEAAPGVGDAGIVLAAPLVEAVRLRLARREQVILLLNRRGYSSFLQCRECGDVHQCPACAVSLTYHRARAKLLCHHCNHEEPAPSRCPRCGSAELSYRGLGTEQVERVVATTFPAARIARMDVDTTQGKWAHHRILSRVERGAVDILLGTQMIAKGLDFPDVTLVGVVNADVGLHLPDFRATERTFQLLSQVAGRTGRGPRGGEVIVQTSVPLHYVLQAAVTHDYRTFAARELEERRDPGYPPYTRMLNVLVSSPEPTAAAAGIEKVADWVRARVRTETAAGSRPVSVTGPAPCPIERLHGRWRWHLLLRSTSPSALGDLGHALLDEGLSLPGDTRLTIDRDPTALL